VAELVSMKTISGWGNAAGHGVSMKGGTTWLEHFGNTTDAWSVASLRRAAGRTGPPGNDLDLAHVSVLLVHIIR